MNIRHRATGSETEAELFDTVSLDDFQRERIVIKEQSCRLYKEIVLTLMRFDVLEESYEE